MLIQFKLQALTAYDSSDDLPYPLVPLSFKGNFQGHDLDLSGTLEV
jgi:hypothetical protein